jgi:hypothetical protein
MWNKRKLVSPFSKLKFRVASLVMASALALLAAYAGKPPSTFNPHRNGYYERPVQIVASCGVFCLRLKIDGAEYDAQVTTIPTQLTFNARIKVEGYPAQGSIQVQPL